MALTKVSGSILKDPLNLGEVSIGGTLTYQDVTNVDALGIGTFRAGINVSGGQVDIGNNVKIGNAGIGTFAGINLGDDQKIFLGNSNDLQIYHGSNVSHIKENGTGPLRISTDEFQLMNVAQNQTMIYAAQNLAVSLNYSGNTKIQTTNTGAVVTGILTASSRVSLGNNTTNAVDLEFGTNRGSAGDTLANINWKWDNTYVAQIRGMAGSDTSNKDDAHLNFYTASAGSLVERLRINRVGNVSIGGLDPVPTASYYDSASLHIHQTANASNVGSQIHLTTANKGSAAGDGSQVSQYNGSLYINNQDDGSTYFYNNGSPTATILGSNGNFGIATQSPTDKLDVNGTAIIRSNLYLSNNTYLASNKGIYFDGGTSANNYLDDFEEGNFTVSVKSTNGGAMNGSFSQQSGRYTKIGRMVHIRFDMTWSGWTNYNGAIQIDNLPFTNLGQASSGGYGAPKFRDCSGISNEIKLYGNSSWFEHNSNRIRVMAWNSSGTEFYVSPNQSGRITGEGVMYTEV